MVLTVADAVTAGKAGEFSVLGWIGMFLWISVTLLAVPMLMFKVIFRFEFGWWRGKSWIPVMQIADATHRERASGRLEARTSLRLKVAVSFVFVSTFILVLILIFYHSAVPFSCSNLLLRRAARLPRYCRCPAITNTG
jgi:hypothetical protein